MPGLHKQRLLSCECLNLIISLPSIPTSVLRALYLNVTGGSINCSNESGLVSK